MKSSVECDPYNWTNTKLIKSNSIEQLVMQCEIPILNISRNMECDIHLSLDGINYDNGKQVC